MRRYYILAKYRRKEHQRAFFVVVVAGAVAQIAAFDLLEKYNIKTDMLANMLPGVCRRKVQHIDQGMQGWVLLNAEYLATEPKVIIFSMSSSLIQSYLFLRGGRRSSCPISKTGK